MARHTPFTPDRLSEAQAAFWREVTEGDRKRVKKPEEFLDENGSLRGPFGPWLHLPETALCVLQVSSALRFNGRLPARQREIAILCVAAHWRADYVWRSHEAFSLKEGIGPDSIAAIKEGRPPAEPDERVIYDVAWPLLTRGRVPGEAFDAAKQALGESLLVELVLLVGQYSLVAMTVGAFDVPAAPGADPVFP